MLVEIDGSIGEGGGQILRYSLALSAVLQIPVRIYNIRAKRRNPGLRPQHLTAVRALAEITDAVVQGDRVGSMEIVFKPRTRKAGIFEFNIGTAGSVTLVLQAVLPALLFSDKPSRITISGGTDVPWSPPIDYMRYVFVHNLRLFGAEVSIELLRRGHYPRGGGRITVSVEPVKDFLRSINIVRHNGIIAVRGRSHAVRLPRHVAERQARAASTIVSEKLGVKPLIDIGFYEKHRDPHLGPGSGIVVYADTKSGTRLGADSLGERGKPAEKVGAEAALKLVEDIETGMAFDRHMADMLIPYMFLAKGRSVAGVAKLTSHALTAIKITKMFLRSASVEIEGEKDRPGIIRIDGIGFSR
ncbi:MAG: RNA 3'-terminal phosphate cyclase [Crenarchaeota archaeon]|nr:RNA 3'-terminal phosphate cyclase [Thermoproteota archaeon]